VLVVDQRDAATEQSSTDVVENSQQLTDAGQQQSTTVEQLAHVELAASQALSQAVAAAVDQQAAALPADTALPAVDIGVPVAAPEMLQSTSAAEVESSEEMLDSHVSVDHLERTIRFASNR